MAQGDIKDTLHGTDVTTGFDAILQDLPPEAIEAAKQLLSISSAPTEAEKQGAQARVTAAYAPVLAAFQAQEAPADVPEPATSSPLQQFAALLSANIASTVKPSFAGPTLEALEQEQKQVARVREINQLQREKFRASHTERGLELAAQMAKDSLAAAASSGDDRATAEKALQLARVNDALARRRKAEEQAGGGAQRRQNIILENSEALKRAVAFKKAVIKIAVDSGMSKEGLARLRANAEFLSDYITKASQKDPMTGVAESSVQDAVDVAQRKFDAVLQDQLQKEGIGQTPADTTQGGGGILGGAAAQRVQARIKELEAKKGKK